MLQMQQYNFKVSRHLNFPHTIQALIPYHPKNLTHPSNICTPYPKCIYIRFFPIFPIKNKNQDLNFSRPQVFYSTHY